MLLRHKRNGIPTHAITRGNLENIYLRERSRTQSHTLCDPTYTRRLEESTGRDGKQSGGFQGLKEEDGGGGV